MKQSLVVLSVLVVLFFVAGCGQSPDMSVAGNWHEAYSQPRNSNPRDAAIEYGAELLDTVLIDCYGFMDEIKPNKVTGEYLYDLKMYLDKNPGLMEEPTKDILVRSLKRYSFYEYSPAGGLGWGYTRIKTPNGGKS